MFFPIHPEVPFYISFVATASTAVDDSSSTIYRLSPSGVFLLLMSFILTPRSLLGGGFKYFLFSHLLGEDSHLD